MFKYPKIILRVPSREEEQKRWVSKFEQLFYMQLAQQDREEAKRKRLLEERQESLKELTQEKPQWEKVEDDEEDDEENFQYKVRNDIKYKRKKIDGMT